MRRRPYYVPGLVCWVPERATAIVAGDRAYLVDFYPEVVRRAAAAAALAPGLDAPVKLLSSRFRRSVRGLKTSHGMPVPQSVRTSSARP